MYCSTIITTKSQYFVHPFVMLHAAQRCCGRQVSKRQAAANPVALLSTVGNVVLEKIVEGIWRDRLNWLAGRMRAVVWPPLA